jgi:hypothetical protein
MELVGGVDAVRRANRPDLLVLGALLCLLVQKQLDGAFDVITIFTFAIFDEIGWNAHVIQSENLEKKDFEKARRRCRIDLSALSSVRSIYRCPASLS